MDASSGKYCGSSKSNVYHYPSCHYVDQIKPENLIWFIDEYDAVNKGYRPCKGCNPPLPSSTTHQVTSTSSHSSSPPVTSTSQAISTLTPIKTSSITQTIATTKKNTDTSTPSQEMLYRVTEVVDGDSIILDDGSEVRLLGINAPEQGYFYYEESKNRISSLILEKQVRLESDFEDTDQYDRLLRYAFVDSTFVNVQLVKEGLATVYMEDGLTYAEELLEAEYYAQLQDVGLWEKDLTYTDYIYLIELHYDAAGNDNDNLNDEYLILGNKGDAPIDMTEWTITDEANHRYTFPLFILDPEEMVLLYSGLGQNTEESLYWGNQGAIWNNDGDTLYLRNAGGELIFYYEYPPDTLMNTYIQSTTQPTAPLTAATSTESSNTIASFQSPIETATIAAASNETANTVLGALTLLVLGGVGFGSYQFLKRRRKPVTTSKTSKDTFCMHCGYKNMIGTSYCMKCGKELTSVLPISKPGKFEVYKDISGKYRFRLRAANGEIIVTGEAYTTKAACFNGVESIKTSVLNARIEDTTK